MLVLLRLVVVLLAQFHGGIVLTQTQSAWVTENLPASLDKWWSYKPGEVGGPENWGNKGTGEHFGPMCLQGKHQSPIDIQTEKLVYDHSLKTLEINGKDDQLEMLIENVGQDIQLSLLSDQVILSGGPFSYDFHVFLIRIKFGSVSSRGSEHKIDGHSFPGELQIYAFNGDLYKNFSHALTQPYGLGAVSVLFELCNTSNKDLLGMVAGAEKTIFKGQSFHIRGLELRSLLSSTDEYITYDGSISFPGCYETVTWIVLNHPISISETEDVAAFCQ